jgi:hypothetical protein
MLSEMYHDVVWYLLPTFGCGLLHSSGKKFGGSKFLLNVGNSPQQQWQYQ